ncbi:hypothetical protein YP76_04900 [Sphingobium chungbukense]|uniref:Lipoprotein n=1 Tax=Sphingobium chungbukense TaxID=56193 RepID=A0A0M3AUT5_9SPHN|nr:hypothetical protein YP76_04900 [Sphingobium chungbukense]
MLSRIYRTRCLLLAASLLLASGCGSREPIQRPLPPAADLTVEPKPLLSPDALGSEAALDQHDIAVESWGERGWAAVARICRWANAHGGKFDCPKP